MSAMSFVRSISQSRLVVRKIDGHYFICLFRENSLYTENSRFDFTKAKTEQEAWKIAKREIDRMILSNLMEGEG